MANMGDVGYKRAHARVKEQKGTASSKKCVKCGAQAAEWAYDGDSHGYNEVLPTNHKSLPYSTSASHYKAMCLSCHRGTDREVGCKSDPRSVARTRKHS